MLCACTNEHGTALLSRVSSRPLLNISRLIEAVFLGDSFETGMLNPIPQPPPTCQAFRVEPLRDEDELSGIYPSRMTAQLVLQFATAEELDSYGRLIHFEDALIYLLGRSAKVDGHDLGSGEMNIFIITEDPVSTFALVQQTDPSTRPSQEMKAAYRPIDGEDFVCLWPPELEHFDVI